MGSLLLKESQLQSTFHFLFNVGEGGYTHEDLMMPPEQKESHELHEPLKPPPSFNEGMSAIWVSCRRPQLF